MLRELLKIVGTTSIDYKCWLSLI